MKYWQPLEVLANQFHLSKQSSYISRMLETIYHSAI